MTCPGLQDANGNKNGWRIADDGGRGRGREGGGGGRGGQGGGGTEDTDVLLDRVAALQQV